jgi:hypothetical protein
MSLSFSSDVDSRGDIRLYSQQFTAAVYRTVASRLGRKLTELDADSIRNYIRQMPRENYKGADPKKLVPMIATSWLNNVYEPEQGDGNFDIHEHLRGELGTEADVTAQPVQQPTDSTVGVTQILNATDAYDVQTMFNTNSLYGNSYLTFDSRYRSRANDGTEFFKWNFANNASPTQGTINAVERIRNIVKMRIGNFRIPYTSDQSADSDLGLVTLNILEFTQKSIGAERSHQFIFDTTVNGTWIDLVPRNKGILRLERPITLLDSITWTFGNPMQPIIFDRDYSTATFTAASPTLITCADSHNSVTGDRVYFTGFSTSNTASDLALINSINRASGWKITNVAATQFTIVLDSTAIVGVPTTCIVYFNSKRIIANIEMTYIKQKDGTQ